MLLYNEKLLLSKRASNPKQNWWFPICEQMQPGLTPQGNCQRLYKEKLRLDIRSSSRFVYSGTYSNVLRGSEIKHNISIIHGIEIRKPELEMNFPREDYSEMKWVSLGDLKSGDYHPMICRAVRDWQLMKAVRTLVSDVETDSTVIAENLKTLCSKGFFQATAESKAKKVVDEDCSKADGSPRVKVKIDESKSKNLVKRKSVRDIKILENDNALTITIENKEANVETTLDPKEKVDDLHNIISSPGEESPKVKFQVEAEIQANLDKHSETIINQQNVDISEGFKTTKKMEQINSDRE